MAAINMQRIEDRLHVLHSEAAKYTTGRRATEIGTCMKSIQAANNAVMTTET